MSGMAASLDLDPFDRMLLTADGTVTSLLEACAGEPITTGQHARQAPPRSSCCWLPRAAGGTPTPAWSSLRRLSSSSPAARSCAALAAAPPMCWPNRWSCPTACPAWTQSASGRGASLGRLLAASRLETHREVLRLTAARAGKAADHLGVGPSATLACRTYRIVVGQRAAAVVTEWLAPGRLAAAALRSHQHGTAWQAASRTALLDDEDVEEVRPPVGGVRVLGVRQVRKTRPARAASP